MEIDSNMQNKILNNIIHPIKLVQPTRLLNKRYSCIGCKEIVILMRKDREIKPKRKVDGNVRKEKPVRNLIGGNKGEIDDYQDHVIRILQLPSFLDANSVEHVAIAICVYQEQKTVEKTSFLWMGRYRGKPAS